MASKSVPAFRPGVRLLCLRRSGSGPLGTLLPIRASGKNRSGATGRLETEPRRRSPGRGRSEFCEYLGRKLSRPGRRYLLGLRCLRPEPAGPNVD
jgi:hypothetical protein